MALTPMKPLDKWQRRPKDGIGMYTAAGRWCPACGRLILDGEWSIEKIRAIKSIGYCRCGQPIDWS